MAVLINDTGETPATVERRSRSSVQVVARARQQVARLRACRLSSSLHAFRPACVMSRGQIFAGAE